MLKNSLRIAILLFSFFMFLTANAQAQPELPEYLVVKSVNCLIDLMATEVAQGHRIEIRGFGAFALHYRAPRAAHNPKTGEKLTTKPKYILRFRAGKPLKERLIDVK